MEEYKYWIWFSRIEGISYKDKYDIICKYKNPEKLFNLMKKGQLDRKNLKLNIIKELNKKEYINNLEIYIKYMTKCNIKILTINDKYYPEKLKRIYDPPVVLFYKGDISIVNNPSIAIIGCRDCSNYGVKLAEMFSNTLSMHNINIVSGLARGIDAHSHIGCLKGNGKTIAIIGNGIDNIYPKENRELANKIIEKNGLILSEYVIGTKPVKKNFPARNRIISGISEGILVIEAKLKSGTLITVDFGLEQGKSIYAIPGNITSNNSEGTNELLKQGAKIVTSIEDILEDYK